MSMGERLWRIARQRVARTLDEALHGSGDPAREELEAFLQDPTPPRRPQPAPAETVSPNPGVRTPHPFEREYRLLGAPVGSDLETVRDCWRRLVRETHPDRFAGQPERQQRATESLRRLNEAYERLRAYLADR